MKLRDLSIDVATTSTVWQVDNEDSKITPLEVFGVGGGYSISYYDEKFNEVDEYEMEFFDSEEEALEYVNEKIPELFKKEKEKNAELTYQLSLLRTELRKERELTASLRAENENLVKAMGGIIPVNELGKEL